MDKKETQKIAKELLKLNKNIKITGAKSDILNFASMPYAGSMQYRDAQNNLIKIQFDHFSIHYEAGINKNGVGDGKEPKIALTYSLGFCLYGEMRLYRHKYWHEAELLKFYSYSRNLPDLINKFKQHLINIKL